MSGSTARLFAPGASPPGASEGLIRSSRSYRRFAALLLAVLGVYLLFDKAAAYLHIPGTPVYLAEALLCGGILAFIRSPSHTVAAVRDDPSLTAVTAFFLWGMARTLANLRAYGYTWVIHDSALWYYCLFAVLIAAVARSWPELPERYARAFLRLIPWLLLWLPIALLLEVNTQGMTGAKSQAGMRVPFSTVSVLAHKPGDLAVVVLIALAGLWLLPDPSRSPARRRWLSLLGIADLLIAGTQNRGGLVAASAAGLVGILLVPGLGSRAVKGLAAVAAVLVGVGFFFPHVGTHSGRSISPAQLGANLESLVGNKQQTALGGTERARQQQWTYVVQQQSSEAKMLAGWGPGPNLGFGEVTGTGDDTLRVPHNSHLDVLARLGVVGLGLWILLWATWCWRLVASRRRLVRARLDHRRGMVDLCLLAAIAILINAFFDPSLEGAQAAVLLWTVFGIGAALSNTRWDPI